MVIIAAFRVCKNFQYINSYLYQSRIVLFVIGLSTCWVDSSCKSMYFGLDREGRCCRDEKDSNYSPVTWCLDVVRCLDTVILVG